MVMHSRFHARNIRIATLFILAMSVACWASDSWGWLTGIRMSLHNAVNPGRLALLSISSHPDSTRSEPADGHAAELSELQNALLVNELQRRQLLLDNARLQQQVRDHQRTTNIQTVTSDELVNFVALKARILSHSGLSGQLKSAILDAGKTQGLNESELVVSGQGIVVDKGVDHRLEAGNKVAHGAAIIGRIAKVSRWVSLVQPVTDEEYAGAVQLVRIGDRGASFGARGLLHGTGTEFCEVTGIPYTEAVSVGDEVFAANVQGVDGPRLYYGKVVHAVFSEGGQWDIVVEPAFKPESLQEVAVVKPRLSQRRVAQSATERGTQK